MHAARRRGLIQFVGGDAGCERGCRSCNCVCGNGIALGTRARRGFAWCDSWRDGFAWHRFCLNLRLRNFGRCGCVVCFLGARCSRKCDGSNERGVFGSFACGIGRGCSLRFGLRDFVEGCVERVGSGRRYFFVKCIGCGCQGQCEFGGIGFCDGFLFCRNFRNCLFRFLRLRQRREQFKFFEPSRLMRTFRFCLYRFAVGNADDFAVGQRGAARLVARWQARLRRVGVARANQIARDAAFRVQGERAR